MSSDQHRTDPTQSPNPSLSGAASNEVATPEVIDAEPEDEAVSLKGYASEEIGFRTPTSRGHKIPRSRSCPPAPRKPRAVSMGLKRKLTFEDAAREEVEAFFDRSKRRSFGTSTAMKTRTTNGNNNPSGS